MNFLRTTFILAALGLLFSATPVAADPQSGSIAGCMTYAHNGLPIDQAWVIVLETGQKTVTDSTGCFDLIDLKPGTYHLAVKSVELGTVEGLAELNVTVSAGRTARLSLALDPRRENKSKEEQKDLQKTIRTQGAATADTEVDPAYRGAVNLPPLSPGESGVAGFVRRPKSEPVPDCLPQPDFEVPPDMFFRDYGTNGFVDTRRDRLSTFAADVDDASFNIVKRYLQDGHLPPSDAVRVEEFVNHFEYGYNTPADETFRVFTEITTSPFDRGRHILKVAVKGREIDNVDRRPLNLTLVIDVSGSMAQGNRFALVRDAIRTLAYQLDANDRIGIVEYGSQAERVLEPIPGHRTHEVLAAADRLHIGGSTYAEAGILLGYEMANRQFVNGHNNMIILCSDGVANVGRTSADEIMDKVRRFAQRGITLSTLGVGMGNYNDVLLEQLAVKGNGRYAYINTDEDIQTVLAEKFVDNVQVLAREVKIQVEFNPTAVASYRLLGYENRAVADDRFRDNRQDGGEVGAGHEVTALYELELNRGGQKAELATVTVRWKNADGTEVFELARDARMNEHYAAFDRVRPEVRLAVIAARFAEVLKGTRYADGTSLQTLYRLAEPLRRDLPGDQTAELVDMMRQALELSDQRADRGDDSRDDYGDFNYKR